MKPTRESYSVPETARVLGFTIKYVYDLVHAGRIAAKKVAGRWRIPKAEIEARRKREQQ